MSILDNLDTNSAISFFITVDFPEKCKGETLDDEDDDGDYGDDDADDNGDHIPHHLFDYHHGLYEYDYDKYHCHWVHKAQEVLEVAVAFFGTPCWRSE